MVPKSQDPGIPEEATKKGPLSRHQQDASLCGGHGVLRCGLARSFGLLFRRGWEVLGCPAGQVPMGKDIKSPTSPATMGDPGIRKELPVALAHWHTQDCSQYLRAFMEPTDGQSRHRVQGW